MATVPNEPTLDDVIALKEREMVEVPGFAPAFTPEEAERAGAFVEQALLLTDLDDDFDGGAP